MISESATILIVEDEQDIRELLAYNLEKEGYATVQAADGKEGLDLARSRKPDLILLDLMLPKMDGLAVCRELERDSGTVRIGAFTSVAVHWLPAVLKSFQRDYPKVEFILKNGDYHDVEQWIRDGSIDVGFVTVPSALGCECIPLKEDRLLAILPRGSRFASYPKFPIVECETEPFISLLESSDHDARMVFEAAGIKPNVRFYTKDDYAIIAMVENGLGMSIMPELLLKGRTDNMQVLPLVPEAKRTIGIAIAAGEKAGPATRRFVDYVVQYVKDAPHAG